MFRASARERASPQRFDHQKFPLYRTLPNTISPPRSSTKRLPSRGTSKTAVPDCVPTGTVLCDVNKLGGLLNQKGKYEPAFILDLPHDMSDCSEAYNSQVDFERPRPNGENVRECVHDQQDT